MVVTQNRARSLAIALRSLQEQDLVAWECIVVDDGSTDSTLDTAQRFAAADGRIRILAHESPVGTSAALDSGVEASRAKFLCLLTDRDFLLPGSLSNRLTRLQSIAPNMAAVCCQWAELDPRDVFRRHRRPLVPPPSAVYDAGNPDVAELPLGSPLIKRDVVVAVGPIAQLPEGGLWRAVRASGQQFTSNGHLGLSTPPRVRSAAQIDMRRPTNEGGPPPAGRGPIADVARRKNRNLSRPRRVSASPTVVPPRRQSAALLLAEAAYHVDELGPLAESLRARGVPAAFMLSPATGPSARRALGRYTDEVLPFDINAANHALAVVVMNDWGPAKPLINRANELGVPTIAKVEGAQDFDDVDTGQHRRPYRTARLILGQGDNDQRALADQDVHIVGSTRLERIWLSPGSQRTNQVLVNLNFTYGVLERQRKRWIGSVERAVSPLGVPAVVSQHPADHSRRTRLVRAHAPIRHELTRSGVLISRFSTVPFEAMARGVPFVYHNPHCEQVNTFASPDDAFPITSTSDDLEACVRSILDEPERWTRSTWSRFFLKQVDVQHETPSESRAAEVIAAAIG